MWVGYAEGSLEAAADFVSDVEDDFSPEDVPFDFLVGESDESDFLLPESVDSSELLEEPDSLGAAPRLSVL